MPVEIGHADLDITANIYSYTMPHMQKEAAEKMSILLQEGHLQANNCQMVGSSFNEKARTACKERLRGLLLFHSFD
jgi:hypothetical protein